MRTNQVKAPLIMNNARVCLIVATTRDNGIGFNQKLPWNHITLDMERFHKLTTSSPETNVLIMGRKTYESIPNRPLKHRYNIVISRNKKLQCVDKNVQVVPSFPVALNEALSLTPPHIFVIGGHSIYQEALQHRLVTRIYQTIVHLNTECDTYFPTVDWSEWNRVDDNDKITDPKSGIDIEFRVFDRIIPQYKS